MPDLPMEKKRHALESFFGQQGMGVQDKPGVQLEIRPYRGYLNLRGDPGDKRFLEIIHRTLAQSLPLVANTFTSGEQVVFWLGPDEWLLVTEPGRERELAGRLRKNLAARFHSLVDLTGGRVLIRLGGHHARDVLSAGCTLDFHPRAFKPGQCAQTVLAKASMLVAMTDDKPVFDIIVHRSFAEYAALWLHRSAGEYGLHLDGRGISIDDQPG